MVVAKRCRHCQQKRDEMRLNLKPARKKICDVGHELQRVEIRAGSPELRPESRRQDPKSQPLQDILTVGFCIGMDSSYSEKGKSSREHCQRKRHCGRRCQAPLPRLGFSRRFSRWRITTASLAACAVYAVLRSPYPSDHIRSPRKPCL